METTPPSAPPASPPPPPPFGSPAPRQLRRLPDHGPIAGVCAGVAEYFNVDPVIVRIAAVVLALTGPGIIAYVLMWIFVPAAAGPPSTPRWPDGTRRDRAAQIFGIVLLAVAVSVLWGGWWSPARHWVLPLGLIALGAWILLRRDDADPLGTAPVPAGPPTGGYPGAAPWSAPGPDAPMGGPEGAEPSDPTAPADLTAGDSIVDPTAVDATPLEPTLLAEVTTDGGGSAGGPPPLPPWDQPPPAPEGATSTKRRRRMLTPLVMGALLVWSGIAWLAGVSVESGLAVGLCIVGVGFVLGAFMGGAWGLVVPAVIIGGALIVASVVDIPLDGPVGDRTWAPQEVAAVQDRYELSIGEGTLDLTGLSLEPGDRLDVAASVGIGHLVVVVPDGAALDITADVSAGEAMLLGFPDSGLSVSTERSVPGDPGAATIGLDLQVGIGQIEVRRAEISLRTRPTTPPSTAPALT